MYCSHYGFSERPFGVTPDPNFLYLSQAHREVLSTLLYGIRERRGFIVVMGEAGTGKTTLLRSALAQVGANVKVATIVNTDVNFDEFLYMLLIDLGLSIKNKQLGKVVAIQRLNELAIEQLRKGGNVVIMVDEAQNLDRPCMENLRLLSNLETSKTKLLQIILSGQPELEDKLKQHDLRQLLQRVNLRRFLPPLNEKEAYAYIQHRLHTAGYEGPALLTGGAQKLIWEYSGGIPRMINTVCDNALLTGYALNRRKIDKCMVSEVIDDLTCNPFGEKVTKSLKTSPEAESVSNAPKSLKVVLSIAALILFAGVCLVAWRLHWNEKILSIFKAQFQAATTDVMKPKGNIEAPSPSPATDRKMMLFPGTVLAPAAEDKGQKDEDG